MFSSERCHETVIPVASSASYHRTILLSLLDENVFDCFFLSIYSQYSVIPVGLCVSLRKYMFKCKNNFVGAYFPQDSWYL